MIHSCRLQLAEVLKPTLLPDTPIRRCIARNRVKQAIGTNIDPSSKPKDFVNHLMAEMVLASFAAVFGDSVESGREARVTTPLAYPFSHQEAALSLFSIIALATTVTSVFRDWFVPCECLQRISLHRPHNRRLGEDARLPYCAKID